TVMLRPPGQSFPNGGKKKASSLSIVPHTYSTSSLSVRLRLVKNSNSETCWRPKSESNDRIAEIVEAHADASLGYNFDLPFPALIHHSAHDLHHSWVSCSGTALYPIT